MATIGFPIATIFNFTGTLTSDVNTLNVPSQGVRSLIIGLSVGTVVGGNGACDLGVGFEAPDGNWYALNNGTIENASGEVSLVIPGPIPENLNVSLSINGASSAYLSYWVIGQA